MPIPSPKKGDKQTDFISRCMADKVMLKEYPDSKKRAGVCYSQWKKLTANAMSINTCISNLQSRLESFEGRKHIVVPVVMLVEGVHKNSAGVVYYPMSEISKYPASWNGVPIPVYHPVDQDGYPVSANTPDLVQGQSVGRLWNVVWEDEKLKGEAWIDIEKAAKISPELLPAIQNDRQIEISTAHFGDSEFVQGEWNGEKYEMVARNIRPDHLAVLPGQTGACSWTDGCGIRANMKGGDNLNKEKYLSPFFNEISHGDIRNQLRSLIPAGGDSLYYFIRDVFDGYFVYVKEENEKATLWKQAYSKDASDKVSLSGNPVEVIEKTEFITLNKSKEENQMANKKTCCPEKVAALIANEKSIFTDDHKEWLETMTEDQLVLMEGAVPVEPETVDHFGQIDWEALTEDQIGTVREKLNLNVETPNPDDKKPATVDEYVANAPEEMQDVLVNGLRMHREKKAGLVANLLGNKRNKFTEDQLKAKDMAELEALVELGTGAPPDYTVNSPDLTKNDEEILEMPSMSFDKEGK